MSRVAFALIMIGLVLAIMGRRKIESDISGKDDLLDDLKDSRYSSEMRFRYLFNSTSDSVYSYSLDAPLSIYASLDEHIAASYRLKLRHANDAFVAALDATDLEDVLGQEYGELDSASDLVSHTAMVTAFVENGYRLHDYEMRYKTPKGEDRALNVNMIGMVRGGMLERIWGVEQDVLDIMEARAELADRNDYQKLVAEVSAWLVTAADDVADNTIEGCIGRIAQHFAADRSTMFWVDDLEKRAISIAYVWSEKESDRKVGFESPISMDMFPNFWRRILERKAVRIDSVESMSGDFSTDAENLGRFGLKSLVVLPMVIGGELVGGITFGRLHNEKAWSQQTVQELTVLTELLANFVFRLKARRALSDALAGLQRATDRLQAENVYLREEVASRNGFDDIVGESPAILRCLNQVEMVANTMTPVVILGETGTGKELIARAIHDHSDRRSRPLVKVNCAALPANLIESELFGHEKGAFTGADARKRGRFDLADGSTLFLDEIGEIPIELQAKLLRVLQEGEFERLGGTETTKVDVRIVVATNRDLGAAVQAGEFRSDLYYRINTFPVELPALRDRGSDIDLLTQHFVRMHAVRLGRDVNEISAEMMRQLRGYHWPGNVRELDGIIQRALISSDGPVVELAEPLISTSFDDGTPKIISSTISDLRLVERDHILTVLEDSLWKISGPEGAASQLGIPPSTLRSKMKRLNITRPG
ncbi:MAG: sigma 54-interacting transcriptional regulator [Gammaproteobacteria bacterium]|nr:sigma 54-interacting transcriptional regulator [Gammaproteobacteria bacterium]